MLNFDEATHTYTYDGVRLPSLSEVLQTVNISDYSGVSEEVMEAARKFGKAVHSACQFYDRGTLNEHKLDDKLRPYLQGWINFCEDFKCSWLIIEEPMCSLKYRFATTPDRIGYVKDRMAAVEIKSTSSLMPSTEVQTAAHALVYNEGASRTMRVLDRYGVLLLPDGVNERNYKIEKYVSKSDESVFRSALNVYYWIRKKKGLKP